MRVWVTRILASAAVLPLAGCGISNLLFGGGPSASIGQTSAAPPVFGYVVADEPQAALIGRQILNQGGNAADAAVAAGFALSATLPSRAGLGGGGACVMKLQDPSGKAQPATVLLFPPGAPASTGGSRPAAVPAMARGLLALQARYGLLPLAAVIAPAERLATGAPVSPALETDLTVVGNALLADPNAAAIFGAGGAVLGSGATLSQPDLAATFEQLRTQGVAGLYQGDLAAQFAGAADAVGGGLTSADLTNSVPVFTTPQLTQAGNVQVAFVPTTAPAGQALPASTGLAVLDKNGGVVACAFTMNNLFGTGRVAPGTGVLLAASPRANPPPVLGAAIANFPGGDFRAAVTGTGQEGAAAAVAGGMFNALHNAPAQAVSEPGRANVISCPGGVPGGDDSCTASADPRGQGLAIGSR